MLTGSRENLMYFARLMGYSKDEAKELVSEEFLREKSVLFWTIVRPIIWVLIGSFTFVSEVKKEVIPYIRGSITISMMTFALTLAGMANLPGNISRDRERGLLAKLKSMPVSPWKDFVGRILGLVAFSCLASILAVMTGVGISVVTASISGLFAPYWSLPPILQRFSQVYPVSSANAAIIYLLLGESYVGYNPLV